MSSISDKIEKYLIAELNGGESIRITRADLAKRFGCVPSQINYVLSTRFTAERGFVVESRRGEGGHVTVTKVNETGDAYLAELVRGSLGGAVSRARADHILGRLYEQGSVTLREYELMQSCLCDRALQPAGTHRDEQRAELLKALIFTLLKHGE